MSTLTRNVRVATVAGALIAAGWIGLGAGTADAQATGTSVVCQSYSSGGSVSTQTSVDYRIDDMLDGETLTTTWDPAVPVTVRVQYRNSVGGFEYATFDAAGSFTWTKRPGDVAVMHELKTQLAGTDSTVTFRTTCAAATATTTTTKATTTTKPGKGPKHDSDDRGHGRDRDDHGHDERHGSSRGRGGHH